MVSYLINEESFNRLGKYDTAINNYSYSIHSKVSAILACVEVLKKDDNSKGNKECITKIEQLTKSIITDFHKSLDYYNNITPFS